MLPMRQSVPLYSSLQIWGCCVPPNMETEPNTGWQSEKENRLHGQTVFSYVNEGSFPIILFCF